MVQRVGKSTIVSLLDISVDPNDQVFQLETGRVSQTSSGTAYEPQRMVVSGSVLRAIYDLIGEHIDEIRRREEESERLSQSAK